MSEVFTLPKESKATCYSCEWSIGSISGLICKKTQQPAICICNKYSREVGADEPEDISFKAGSLS